MELKPLRVFVLGSCVTRDAFNYDENGSMELAFYIARTSFASQNLNSWEDSGILEKINSPFQKKMVKIDLQKSLLFYVNEIDYDLIVVDLIDDRFDLVEYEKNCFATRSVEFLKGANNNFVSRMSHHGDQYEKNWKEGFDKFISNLEKSGALFKLRINEVYWAEETNECESIPGFEKDKIVLENSYLKSRYKYIREKLQNKHLISYNKEVFKADVNHKWGVSPFHYDKVFYENFLNVLKNEKLKEQN